MNSRSIKGFTLLEVLIAVFIVTIIGVMTVRGLQLVISARDSLTRNSERLQSVSLAMSLLRNDLQNMINRSVKIADNKKAAAVILQDDGQQTLAFTRGGVSNPLDEHRSTMQRVAYQLHQGTLWRLSWPVLDRVALTKVSKRILLKHVTYLQWKFVDNNKRYYPLWPASNAIGQPLPTVVKVTLKVAKLGTITRYFAVNNHIVVPTFNFLRMPHVS